MSQVTKLTIDSSKIPSDLTDYPVYVDLSDMNAEFWSTVANGGGDIRVYKSDGTTELPREVVSCDTSTQTGELHFKYTGTLSSSVDTEVQIHADGTSADYATTDTYGAENVWTGYEFVYHLQSGGKDSTGNVNATLSGTSSVSGNIGNGRSFDESANDYLQIQDSTAVDFLNTFDTSDKTIQAWFKPSVNTDYQPLTYTEDSDGAPRVRFFAFGTGLNFAVEDDAGTQVTATASSVMDTTFQMLHGTWDSTNKTATVYRNGSQEGTATDAGFSTVSQFTSAEYITFGASNEGGSINTLPASQQDVSLDEIRISNIKLSSDWITTEYNNQNSPSTFYTATSPMLTANITDTMSLSETTTTPRDLLFSHTDTVEMTDSNSALKVLFVNIVETLNLSETVSGVRSRLANIIDSVNLTEFAEARKKIRNRVKNIATGISNSVKNIITVKNRDKSE